MLLKKIIIGSVFAISFVGAVQAQSLLAYDDSSSYSDSNVNANVWQHDAKSSEEMGKAQTEMVRDRRLNELLPDSNDYKFKADSTNPDDSQQPIKHVNKKRAHYKKPLTNDSETPTPQNSQNQPQN